MYPKKELIPEDFPDGMPKKLAMEYLNAHFAIIEVGAQTYVVEYGKVNKNAPSIYTKAEAARRLSDVIIKGDGKPLSAFEVWDKTPSRKKRKYNGLIFLPGGVVESHLADFDFENPRPFVAWYGWGVEAKKGRCTKFLELVRNVGCSRNQAHFDYLIRYFAHMFQRPWERCDICLVVRGDEGTGKTRMLDTFGKLVHPFHFIKSADPKKVFGNFDLHLAYKLFFYGNEALWPGDKKAQGALKAKITEPELLAEGKFKDPVTIQNFCRFAFDSNESWVVPAGRHTRRFFVLDVADTHRNDRAYFGPIVEELENGGYEALLWFLKYEVKLDGFDVTKPPMTKGLIDQKMETADSVETFWLDQANDGGIFEQCEAQGFVFKESLFDSYRTGSYKTKYRESRIHFWRRTNEIIGRVEDAGKRVRVSKGPVLRVIRLPKLEDALANLLKYFDIPDLKGEGG